MPSVWLGFEPGMTKPDFLKIECHDIAGRGLGNPSTEPEDRLAPAAFSLAGESRTRTILEEAGYEVVVGETGTEAIGKVGDVQFVCAVW